MGLTLTEKTQILFLEALETFVKTFQLENTRMVLDVLLNLGQFTFQMLHVNDENKVEWVHSEEVRFASCKVLEALFQQCQNDENLWKFLADLQLRPLLGQIVSSLLDFAQFDRLRKLQIKTCCVLDEIVNCFALHKEGLDIIASFLPGMCSSLTKIINGDNKQGS